MSAAYRRAGRRVHQIKIGTSSGAWIARASGTRDASTARKMQAMLDALGPQGKRAWDILDRLEARTLAVPALWDLWAAHERDLERVRAHLDDVDLAPWVLTWARALDGPAAGISADTAAHYLAAVRLLIAPDAPFPRSALTAARLLRWVDEMAGVAAATVRKRGQGMRRFTRFLVDRLVLTADPMRDVVLPAPGRPRVAYLETADARRLADAQPAPYAAFAALLAGSGIEVSVALTLRRRDVDVPNREIRAAGTKTHARDRIVRVAEWAWAYLVPLLSDRHPDARLFDGIAHRWAPRDAHAAAVVALVDAGHQIYAGYTMRDHRHTYAVRAIRAGTPAELVARQLGHVSAVLVHKVYGRFAPTQRERDTWERVAAAQDVATAGQSVRGVARAAFRGVANLVRHHARHHAPLPAPVYDRDELRAPTSRQRQKPAESLTRDRRHHSPGAPALSGALVAPGDQSREPCLRESTRRHGSVKKLGVCHRSVLLGGGRYPLGDPRGRGVVRLAILDRVESLLPCRRVLRPRVCHPIGVTEISGHLSALRIDVRPAHVQVDVSGEHRALSFRRPRVGDPHHAAESVDIGIVTAALRAIFGPRGRNRGVLAVTRDDGEQAGSTRDPSDRADVAVLGSVHGSVSILARRDCRGAWRDNSDICRRVNSPVHNIFARAVVA